MQNVLVVGQVPPPLHGQAIAIEKLLKASLPQVQLHHVPMDFSSRIDEVGRFGLGKVLRLIRVVLAIFWSRMRYSTTVLYYPPAGPNRIPMYRDWAILLTTRWLFKQVVFHFHAAGLTELLPDMNRLSRFLFRLAYGRPTCAIHLADAPPQDGHRLNAQRCVVVPYGIEDAFPQYRTIRQQDAHREPRILFVGALRESKGVMVLLEACAALRRRGLAFQLELMGDFGCPEFETRVKAFLASRDLQRHVHFLGVCQDEAKWQAYAKADIFCFPSFYECENLPVVIIEAMQFELPVVTTRWRGIPALVEDEAQGFLVSIHAPEEVAERLARLILDPDLRRRLGRSARERYLQEFTLQKWTDSMGRVFRDLEPSPFSECGPALAELWQ